MVMLIMLVICAGVCVCVCVYVCMYVNVGHRKRWWPCERFFLFLLWYMSVVYC